MLGQQFPNMPQLLAPRVGLHFHIGNRHSMVPNPRQSQSNSNLQNKHKWTAFVEFRDESLNQFLGNIIERVEFRLHPTFKKNYFNIPATQPDQKF